MSAELAPPQNVDELEDRLSLPSPAVVETLAGLPGDLLLLGVGGKMGPTLARMAQRASAAAGQPRRIFGVSRFSNPALQHRLKQWGIETIRCDLLEESAVEQLPEVPHVLYLPGMKFGTGAQAATTWAMNTYLPAIVSRRFRQSRIVAFSTGNVYPLVPVASGGCTVEDPPNPVGEYGMSALGRERMFEFFSRRHHIPVTLLRLNYACELRYGVLVDIAQLVLRGQPVPLAMGYFNIIWQGDANAIALQSLATTASPPALLNLTGPQILDVRGVAEAFGRLLGKPVQFSGTEQPTALLNNAQPTLERFGPPRISPQMLMEWIADWIRRGGPSLGKPTHFEARDGKF